MQSHGMLNAMATIMPRIQAAILALGLILLVSGCSPGSPPTEPTIKDGLLDLRGWNFSRQALVELRGDWGFVPGKFLYEYPGANPGTYRTVPDLWKDKDAGGPDGTGHGTYFLTILLPPWLDRAALRLRTVSTSYQLQVDQHTIANAGYPSAWESQAIPAYHPHSATFPVEKNRVQILLRVSNWHYRNGGLWRAPSFGLEAASTKEKYLADFLAIVTGTALVSIGFSMFIIFLFRRKESYYLYFALFTLVMALRTLVTGEYLIQVLLPSIPFELMIKLEYLTMVLSLFCCIPIFTRFFPGRMSQTIAKAMAWPFLPYLALILWSPLPFLTRTPGVFYVFALVAVLLLFFKILVPAFLQKTPGSALMLWGAMVLAVSAVNDALHASFIIHTSFTMTFALGVFVIMQMTALTARFTRAIDQTEQLANELTLSNERLRDEIVGSVRKQGLLEDLVHEKDLLVREVHHRVKNSLQLVSSVLVLQSNRTSDNRTKTLLQTLRMRIQAISLVHEKLYGNVSTGSLMLKDYAMGMIDLLAAGFGIRKNNLISSIPDLGIEVGIDYAIDLGLIMSELVSNACKYSQVSGSPYPEQITISMGFIDDAVWLRVEDKGPGFPADHDPGSSVTLGHLMVRTLLKRSRGTMEILPGPGGRVQVSMPLEGFKDS